MVNTVTIHCSAAVQCYFKWFYSLKISVCGFSTRTLWQLENAIRMISGHESLTVYTFLNTFMHFIIQYFERVRDCLIQRLSIYNVQYTVHLYQADTHIDYQYEQSGKRWPKKTSHWLSRDYCFDCTVICTDCSVHFPYSLVVIFWHTPPQFRHTHIHTQSTLRQQYVLLTYILDKFVIFPENYYCVSMSQFFFAISKNGIQFAMLLTDWWILFTLTFFLFKLFACASITFPFKS